jgi:UV DNA damage endonuclease
MAKRKRSSVAAADAHILSPAVLPIDITSDASGFVPGKPAKQARNGQTAKLAPGEVDVNPDTNPKIEDGQEALRASPDAEVKFAAEKVTRQVNTRISAASTPKTSKGGTLSSDSELSELEDVAVGIASSKPKSVPAAKRAAKKTVEAAAEADPEAEGEDEDADPEELKQALSRPPPVNSDYLPLPWKGRIGYACLNTYLRAATPPIFSSRTCRIASILEHRHPLKDPSQPEHATKNRPDKDQPADVARGQAYVEALGLANAQDISKMLCWNDKYGIKFLRLSSEMFPFASHDVYGYKLAPFASDALAEAGKVAAELGHRLTTHPGQFTQLGSPRTEVITAAIRDLEYHCELLDLLQLPPQVNRDAVMILHMGGIFGDKQATLDRFRNNYIKLSQGIKNRLVLENDDVCYSVHDLLPICEELNIPLVLDYHHHNIIFDAEKIREGTKDIMDLYPRIKATWDRKNIKQKMHYSEPTPAAITGRQRRKHSQRVATLPPCAPDMDLMIEAKDKEQAVFELMRIFKLPKFDTFNDILPYTRTDENKPWKPPKKKTPMKKKKNAVPGEVVEEEAEPQPPPIVPDDEIAMGGPEGRVYWPPGMEEWLRPKKREVKPRDAEKAKSTAEKAAGRRAEKAAWQAAREASAEGGSVKMESASQIGESAAVIGRTSKAKPTTAAAKSKPAVKAKKSAKAVPTPSTSDHESKMSGMDDEEGEDAEMPELIDGEEQKPTKSKRAVKAVQRPTTRRRQSDRGARKAVKNYAEDDGEVS